MCFGVRRQIFGATGGGHTADLLLMRRLAMVSTGWKTINSAMPEAPDPRIRALAESLPLPPTGGDMLLFLGGEEEKRKREREERGKKPNKHKSSPPASELRI